MRPGRLQNLPLRAQLMIAFAVLSTATTVISVFTLTHLSGERMRIALHDRAQRIAERMRAQLKDVDASNDRQTARELLASYAIDRDLDGMGLYAENGALIEGIGERPERLSGSDTGALETPDHTVAIADFKGSHHPWVRVYVSCSTRTIDAKVHRDGWIAVGVGAGVVIFALALAVLFSRRMSRRLVQIAEAAQRVASGDRHYPALDDSARDEIGRLAHAFNVMVAELNRLSAKHERMVETERERLERLVSERTQALQQSREMFRLIAESTQAIPFTLDLASGAFLYVGAQASAESAVPEQQWQSPGALELLIPRPLNPEIRQRLDACPPGPFEFIATLQRSDGRREVRWTGTCEVTRDTRRLRGLMLDITDMRRMARELASSQKLESVGRLAAGVAHEINTPVQFVSDNVEFVRSAIKDILSVIEAYRRLQTAVRSSQDAAAAGVAAAGASAGAAAGVAVDPAAGAAAQAATEVVAAAELAAEAERAADLDYLMGDVTPALDSAIDGLRRIATIVRSMKEFAYPDQAEMKTFDLNSAIQSTLVIARNEYKHLAELETDFGDLPLIQGYLGEINQVVLNLIINAAHAIGDVVRDSNTLGKLTVRTCVVGDEVELSITDTGSGIPEGIRDKIFDPFFTTKEVGKGTGQGLALAHGVVVVKHGGSIRFETECGKGTTFFIRLPISGRSRPAQAEAVAA